MSLKFDILRPDDLVCLTIEAQNLRLDAKDAKNPMLVLDQSSSPAYLVVTFPPQSIIEQAYFETAVNFPQEPAFNNVPAGAPLLPTTDDNLDLPGSVPARMAGPSRLVFQFPKNISKIPYQTSALLDWTQLQLVVSATAQGVPSPTIPQPGPLETALELPYRLILSPGKGVGWVNALSPVTHGGRSELWHTRLAKVIQVAGKSGVNTSFQEASLQHTIPLRAIWSPDLAEERDLSHDLDQQPFPLQAAMTPRDRAQIVILTSGSVGYYLPGSQGTAQWKPTPFNASRLFLSAQGGWLSSIGRWSPLPSYNIVLIPITKPAVPLAAKAAKTAKSRLAAVTPVVKQPPAVIKQPPVVVRPPPVHFPQETVSLDLGEWSHLATQGRDHYVRIVYEGYLYPFGHRASLVKVTERKFVPPGAPDLPTGAFSVTVYLRQHMFIVVREPELSYKPSTYANQGREMPFYQSVRINTLVTPDIDKPQNSYVTADQNSFWINVNNANFQFHVTAKDLAGAKIDFLAPMIFVTDSENDVGAVPPGTSDATSVKNGYLAAGGLGPPCTVKGKKVAYADPGQGDTILKTTALYFDAQILIGGEPFTSLPFMPTLAQATVSVPSLEELLGVSSPVNIEFYDQYLQAGLDGNAGVFAEIVGTGPNVGFTADRAGGFATPNLALTALSARKGLVAGSAGDAAKGYIDPTAFFGGVTVEAMLFGTIPLGNLIPTPILDNGTQKASAGKNAPEIRTQAKPNSRQPQQLITKINWVPDLQSYDAAPLHIAFDPQASKFSLNATITRNLDGTPPQSSVKGELSNFMITLDGVIGVQVTSIKFSSTNGSKTNVVAKLANNKAIQFIGPLGFLQELANILPPGIFGGQGPSIDLTSTEIKISYTLGLPPISIGVFTLEHIAITTGIDLPYLNGQPALEFAFASRSKPFLLTVECLGGGGFVHLILNSSGIQMVEGALEFGGQFSMDVGVASGGVQIMAGIYFKLAGSSSTVTGFVDISGEVSMLGILSISIDLNLSLSWISDGSGNKIQGRATLSISVSICFFSISVSVSVERSFGSGQGDPRVAEVMSANDWAAYALAFAS
ncbi:MAG: hypothetical protein ACLQVY_30310 [Limisphaerales bacterium]